MPCTQIKINSAGLATIPACFCPVGTIGKMKGKSAQLEGVDALIDTGASGSCISGIYAQAIGLVPSGKAEVRDAWPPAIKHV